MGFIYQIPKGCSRAVFKDFGINKRNENKKDSTHVHISTFGIKMLIDSIENSKNQFDEDRNCAATLKCKLCHSLQSSVKLGICSSHAIYHMDGWVYAGVQALQTSLSKLWQNIMFRSLHFSFFFKKEEKSSTAELRLPTELIRPSAAQAARMRANVRTCSCGISIQYLLLQTFIPSQCQHLSAEIARSCGYLWALIHLSYLSMLHFFKFVTKVH